MTSSRSTKKRFLGKMRGYKFAYICVSPTIIVLAIVILYPILFGLYMSFHEFYLVTLPGTERPFVGLANYQYIVQEETFVTAFTNTAIWSIGVVSITYLVGLFLALLLNEKISGRGFYRTLAFLPWGCPFIVGAVVWSWLYNPTFGIFNEILSWLGFQKVLFLGDPSIALFSVMMVEIWKFIPFCTVSLLAGLQSVPSVLYDAASIDGASMFQRFRHVSFPMIHKSSLLVVSIIVVWSFRAFVLVYAMTFGGPASHTQTLSLYAWFTAFLWSDLGRAEAVGTLMTILMLVFASYWLRTMIKLVD